MDRLCFARSQVSPQREWFFSHISQILQLIYRRKRKAWADAHPLNLYGKE